MKIAVGSEKISFSVKEAIIKHLYELGHEVTDVGASSADDGAAYYDVAATVAGMIQNRECEKAIVMCGTGAGVSIVANKFKGVFAVAVESEFSARMASAINNANVISMGGWIVAPRLACEIVDAFLTTSFTEGIAEDRKQFLKDSLEITKNIDSAIRT